MFNTITTTPAQDAALIRRTIKAAGIDPKGMVRVRRSDYDTSIEIFAHGSERNIISDALIEIDSKLSWPIDW